MTPVMETRAPTLLPSGIEPIDKLLGGLESGLLYLVHGDPMPRSLFGVKFLLEGLRHGQNGALIIRYSPEDAVRRFARLGYDCIEDVQRGRLIILEFADDIVEQVVRQKDIGPLLRELGGLLGETQPQRLVFDPVGDLVASQHGDLEQRVREFAQWAKGLGATSLLVASSESQDVIRCFSPEVREVFRFDLIEGKGRTQPFLTFEKSSNLPLQPVEVDPSRGIFLLSGTDAQPGSVSPEAGWLDIAAELLHASESAPAEAARAPVQAPEEPVEPQPATRQVPQAPPDVQQGPEPQSAEQPAELNDWLDELIAWAIGTPGEEQKPDTAKSATAERPAPAAKESKTQPHQAKIIDPATAARTAEELLRPPDLEPSRREPRGAEPSAAVRTRATAHPKDFNVLIIAREPSSKDLLMRAVAEYTVETADEPILGLAKLVAIKPDLVILDLDLPAIDGFKVLSHLRSNLNTPIIVVSGLYVRSSDRIQSAELGADYYLTKPFSVKELRQKAKQLIARYRGISDWISGAAPHPRESWGLGAKLESARAEYPPGRSAFAMSPGAGVAAADAVPATRSAQGRSAKPTADQFVPYPEFVARVEESVKLGMEAGSSFSIVGCRMPEGAANGLANAVWLFGLIRSVVRNADLISMNQRNDFVVLLSDADAGGAKAFVARLCDRVSQEMSQEPLVWLRSFPHLEEATESGWTGQPGANNKPAPAADWQPDRVEPLTQQVAPPPPPDPPKGKQADKLDPRESYINLLKNL